MKEPVEGLIVLNLGPRRTVRDIIKCTIGMEGQYNSTVVTSIIGDTDNRVLQLPYVSAIQSV